MSAEIGVGFIGAGSVFPYHLAGMLACEGAKPIGLYDKDQQTGIQEAEKYGLKRFESAEELVSDPEVQAVLVLTPLEDHFPNVKLALHADKHVLVEKPVGVSVAEIQRMKILAQRRNLVCMPGHNNIYHPNVVKMKESIESGRLGQLSEIYLMYNIFHPEETAKKYPGVIKQVGSHHAYTLLYLAGLPKSIAAMKTVQHYQEYKKEDIFMAIVKMRSNALAHLSVNFAADDHSTDPWSLIIKVLGFKGTSRFSHNDEVVNEPGIVHSHTYVAYPDSIIEEDKYFINCIRDKSKQPLSTLDDAIRVQKILRCIEKAAYTGRTQYTKYL